MINVLQYKIIYQILCAWPIIIVYFIGFQRNNKKVISPQLQLRGDTQLELQTPSSYQLLGPLSVPYALGMILNILSIWR